MDDGRDHECGCVGKGRHIVDGFKHRHAGVHFIFFLQLAFCEIIQDDQRQIRSHRFQFRIADHVNECRDFSRQLILGVASAFEQSCFADRERFSVEGRAFIRNAAIECIADRSRGRVIFQPDFDRVKIEPGRQGRDHLWCDIRISLTVSAAGSRFVEPSPFPIGQHSVGYIPVYGRQRRKNTGSFIIGTCQYQFLIGTDFEIGMQFGSG